MKPQAIVFDAYGTLFDVHAVIRASGAGIGGDIEALSTAWRQKQVEHTWRRALMDRYQDFWLVTEEALRAAAEQLSIAIPPQESARLMQAYLSPPAFLEVSAVLETLTDIPLAILSNGTPAMIQAAVRSNSLEHCFAHLISVDAIRSYKPKPEVYALGPKALGVPAEEMLFVSANIWDAAGARACGYRVCWCNRSQAPADALGFAPDVTVPSLSDLPPFLRMGGFGSERSN